MNKHLKIYDQFPQNTPPWEFVRMGMITASEFQLLLRKGVGGKGPSATRERRAYGCAWELMTLQRPDTWQGNKFTERGHEQEEEALSIYCDVKEVTPEMLSRPAFIRRADLNAGMSPDALIGNEGGVEIKTMSGDLFLKLKDDPGVPPEHLAQVQGSLLLTDRKWWDLVIYAPPEPPFITRVLPDVEFHRQLREGIAAFNKEVEGIVLRQRGETVKTCRDRLEARLAEVIADWQEPGELSDAIAEVEPPQTPLTEAHLPPETGSVTP